MSGEAPAAPAAGPFGPGTCEHCGADGTTHDHDPECPAKASRFVGDESDWLVDDEIEAAPVDDRVDPGESPKTRCVGRRDRCQRDALPGGDYCGPCREALAAEAHPGDTLADDWRRIARAMRQRSEEIRAGLAPVDTAGGRAAVVAALLVEADEGGPGADATVSLTAPAAEGGGRRRISLADYATDPATPLGDLASLVLDLRQLAAEADDPQMRALEARLDVWRLSAGR